MPISRITSPISTPICFGCERGKLCQKPLIPGNRPTKPCKNQLKLPFRCILLTLCSGGPLRTLPPVKLRNSDNGGPKARFFLCSTLSLFLSLTGALIWVVNGSWYLDNDRSIPGLEHESELARNHVRGRS